MTLLFEHEAMAVLRCSRSTMKRLRKRGDLVGSPGRPVRYEAAAVEAYRKSLFCRSTSTDDEATDAEVAALARRSALKRRLAKGK